MRQIQISILALITISGAAIAQEAIPPALREMAETEREFARVTTVKGVRDAFLEFFAPDSLAFTPGATSARDRLLKQDATPFSVDELLWEPRLGDVSASGDLGWLTGPSTYVDHSVTPATPHYGNYLSVWRRQADGRWKVFIDVGTPLRSEAAFAPGFTRMPMASRYTGKEDGRAAGASLVEVDRRLNAAVGADGASRAYAAVSTPSTRLHRPGTPAVAGTEAVAAWLEANAAGMSATSTSAEAAASGDFGYSYGRYELKADSGAYIRLWSRDSSGHWWLVVDVIQRASPPSA